MNTIEQLILVADAYKAASSIDKDGTVSHRVFGDTKKLSALRSGSDITTRRLGAAFRWFSENWPDGEKKPEILLAQTSEGAT